MEPDSSIPILIEGQPKDLPFRFKQMLDVNASIPETILYVEQVQNRKTEWGWRIVSVGLFAIAGIGIGMSLWGLFNASTVSRLLIGLIAVFSLTFFVSGLGAWISARSSSRLRKLQNQSLIRLGVFFAEDALLQHHGNCVTLLPKNRIKQLKVNHHGKDSIFEFQFERSRNRMGKLRVRIPRSVTQNGSLDRMKAIMDWSGCDDVDVEESK